MLAASDALAMWDEPYTLAEIESHIRMVAHKSTSVYGYKGSRLTTEVKQALRDAGYKIGVVGNDGDWEISWKEPGQ